MIETSGRSDTAPVVIIGIVYYSYVRRSIVLIPFLLSFTLAGCYSGSRPPRIGTAAPTFAIQDADHKMTLDQFRGKTVVLNFWATWCPPCVEEMPSLVQLQERFHNSNVVVLGVSEDVDEDAYRKFIKQYKINFPTVDEPDHKTSNLYGTFKFPETYIIDKNGIVRRKFIGAVEWSQPEIVDYLSKL